MAHTNPGVPPTDVRKVQKRFEEWRTQKRGRERIPESLWNAAAKLCETHRVHRMARWLRLNHAALRSRMRSTGRGSRRSPAFVEWVPAAMQTTAAASVEYLLEVEPAGEERTLRVRVRGATVAEVAALARALRRDEREG